MEDIFYAARSRMAQAIAQAHPGRAHAHWFGIFLDNLIYRPLFGKTARALRAHYGVPRRSSLCAVLPEEARQAMIQRMTFITEHLTSGKDYAEIKELILSELATQPLVLERVSEASGAAGQGRKARRKQGSGTQLPSFGPKRRECDYFV